MGGWLPSPGAFEACECCGREFPAQSLGLWCLVHDGDESGPLIQVCCGCAVKLRERAAKARSAEGSPLIFTDGFDE